MKICPKCNFLDHETSGPSYECPKCGVIYSKVIYDINKEKIKRNEEAFKGWKKHSKSDNKKTVLIWASLLVIISAGFYVTKNSPVSMPIESAPQAPQKRIESQPQRINFPKKYEMRITQTGRCGFTVRNNGSENTIFILLDNGSKAKIALLYVPAGDELSIQIPAGMYAYQMIQGSVWLGDQEHFGFSTKYFEGKEILEVTDDGRRYTSREITLNTVNGNMHPVRSGKINI